jgi:hypothetical protein
MGFSLGRLLVAGQLMSDARSTLISVADFARSDMNFDHWMAAFLDGILPVVGGNHTRI